MNDQRLPQLVLLAYFVDVFVEGPQSSRGRIERPLRRSGRQPAQRPAVAERTHGRSAIARRRCKKAKPTGSNELPICKSAKPNCSNATTNCSGADGSSRV